VIDRRCIEVYETGEAVGARGAELFLAAAREALAARGRFSVALSGGLPRYRSFVTWPKKRRVPE
jgi:6-phosphogluconolactonase/glucosamine-6-phosphate isomerase/deaminase